MADFSTMSTEELTRLRDEIRTRNQPQPAPTALPGDLTSLSTEELTAMRDRALAQQPGFWESLGRGGMQGATLGGGDEVYAGGAGALAKARGEDFMPVYERQLAETQGNNKAAKEAHPWAYTAGEMLGAVPGLAIGGTTALGAKALGLVGKSLMTRSGAAAASGAVMGGVQGFAGTDGDFDERKNGAINGGAYGVALGGAAPAFGQAVGGAARGVMNAVSPSVRGLERPAATLLAEDVANSGGPAAIRQRMQELGPDAVLLDASQSLRGRGQGLAVQPDTREMINAPLIARNEGTNGRLAADVEGALGPAPIPSRVEAELAGGRRAMAEGYAEPFRNARAVDTRDLANALDTMAVDLRGPAAQAVTRARNMLDIPGNPGTLDPNPRALFEVRQALDGLLDGETNTKVVSQLGFVRQAVDDDLRRAVPGIKDVDARYQELARQSEGLTRGGQVLDTGKTAIRPAEMVDEVRAGVTPENMMVGPSATSFRMRQGLRADIDRRVGTEANDLEALRKSIKGEGDWNRPKMAELFGEAPTDRVFGAVDRERTFRDSFNKVVENSQTSMRERAAAGVQPRGESPAGGDIGTVVAGAVAGPKGAALAQGLKALRSGNDIVMKAADIDRNKEIAKVLMKGLDPEIDIMLEALARRASGDKRAITVGKKAETLAQLLMQSQGGVAGENAPPSLRLAR